MEKNSDKPENTLRPLDFVTSIILFLISIFIVWESMHINQEVGGPIYSSPGLMPLFLGFMMLLCSVLLFIRSVKKVGISGNLRDFKDWFAATMKTGDTTNILMGIGALAVFTFILLPRLPFLLSSFIFLVLLMKILKAGSYLKITIISIIVSVSVFTLFQIIFKVPLP